MMENIFRTELLDFASKLDAVTNSHGNIVKETSAMVEEQDNKSTIYLVNLSSKIIKSSEYPNEVKRLASLFKDSVMKFFGYIHITEAVEQSCPHEDEDYKTLDELLVDLNNLIGLKEVKSKVNDLIAYHKIQLLREQHGLHLQKRTMHLAFTGNPGTGKTTVARIVGRIFKQIGLLSKGHFIEVSRTDLIAGYQGQTALKVKKVIDQAKGGVLFIDEAYSITENDHSDSYGRECLTELTKALEDNRDDLVVIVAGYTEPMAKFFQSNPGLKSRFNTFIEFPDYSADELEKIFMSICTQNDYVLDESAIVASKRFFSDSISNKDENFANGRLARNLFDDIVINQARRISKLDNVTDEVLMTITERDF